MRRHAIGLALTTLCLGAPAIASDSDDLTQSCAQVACRTEERVMHLRTPQGTIDVPAKRAPYVTADGAIVIFSGEAFEVTYADRNDLAHPKFSKVIEHVSSEGVTGYKPGAPPPTGPAILQLELKQNDDGSTWLIMRNDTGVGIKFAAREFVPVGNEVRNRRTSICPTLPGMMGTESWQEPVAMIVLDDAHPADLQHMVCD